MASSMGETFSADKTVRMCFNARQQVTTEGTWRKQYHKRKGLTGLPYCPRSSVGTMRMLYDR